MPNWIARAYSVFLYYYIMMCIRRTNSIKKNKKKKIQHLTAGLREVGHFLKTRKLPVYKNNNNRKKKMFKTQ